MNMLRLVVAGILVAGLTVGARAEEKKAEATKEKLVGTWEVSKADEGTAPLGATLMLTKDGKVKFTAKKDGEEKVIEGTYTFADGKLTLTRKKGDQEDKQVLIIKSVNDSTLVVEDPKGKSVEMKRKK